VFERIRRLPWRRAGLLTLGHTCKSFFIKFIKNELRNENNAMTVEDMAAALAMGSWTVYRYLYASLDV